MKAKFSKGVVLGALVSTLVLAASAAVAATGGNFILGSCCNTADKTTVLKNTNTAAGQIGLDVTGNSTSSGIRGQNARTGPGVSGHSAAGIGVFGRNNSASSPAPGVEGQSSSSGPNAIGVLGRLLSTTPGGGSAAVRGQNSGTNGNGSGVTGTHAGSGIGVFGDSASGIGSFGRSKNADGYGGWFQNATTGIGSAGTGLVALGRGHTEADLGIGPDGFDGAIEAAGPNGVEGNSKTPGGFGVSGDGPAVGVNATATAAGGTGVNATGGSSGVGVNASGGTTGVSAAGGTNGLLATGGSFGVDTNVTGASAVGIRSTAGSSSNDAVQGVTSSGTGDALQGITSGGAAFGLFAITSDGTGVVSSTVSATAVAASNGSGTNATVMAANGTAGGTAGTFRATNGVRVRPMGTSSTGLTADMTGDTNSNGNTADDANNAIFASSDDTNNSAVIFSNTLPAPTCDEFTCEAIETNGFVDVNGNARVTGTLTKGAGSFEIDHPQDPSHYYLRHSFVESPDMKNVYDGVVTTGKKGKATVKLPTYFASLNRSFRYQLTVIGADFAQAIVSKEIAPGGRSFKIRTNKAHVKVSWQVTGIRKDAYANAHRIKVVERKRGAAANMYLHPELFGHPNARPLGLDTPKRISTLAADRAQGKLNALVQRKAAQARKEAAQKRHASAPKVQQQRSR